MPMKRISMHLDIFLYWSMMIKENQITIWDQFKKSLLLKATITMVEMFEIDRCRHNRIALD
ncbi:hypothetical protein T12_12271 [Trichinella patagoniensis]|uniref:Uncharacterized protein n=1 Tax=Trichinella patagoniensis TaxID=990121 RepID=A0A0V0ZRV3_9BILA|nr:hypothetical protein T12_12271 [Trichinella patagoniensis]